MPLHAAWLDWRLPRVTGGTVKVSPRSAHMHKKISTSSSSGSARQLRCSCSARQLQCKAVAVQLQCSCSVDWGRRVT